MNMPKHALWSQEKRATRKQKKQKEKEREGEKLDERKESNGP